MILVPTLDPARSRADWAKNHGLTHFLSREFTESMDHVCKMMGVSPDHIKHSKPNNILIDSSRKLGYHVDSIPVRLVSLVFFERS